MKVKAILGLSALAATMLIVSLSLSQSVPQLINYQGRLTDSAGLPLADGSTVDLTFAFYGVETGATPLYLSVLQEDVVVNGGIYNVLIGSGTITPGTESTIADVFQKHSDVWMGVKVDTDAEMTPRSRISSVPYAVSVDTRFIGDIIGKSDWDGDGYLKTGNTVDCNDGDASINPGASEVCDDGIDNDCDGDVDAVDSGCAGMALIPSGCYDIGDSSDGCGYSASECPVHNVCITSDFYMDVHEVTNAEYAACVSGGGCTAPVMTSSATRPSYYGNPAYDNFPVIYVSWNQATDYCTWAGKRLPTEAEWEYAARGGLSGKRYPWGDSISGSDANYWNSGDPWDNDTSEVQYYTANGYGLYDMAGNVWEWVNDWYSATYYQYCVDNTIVNDPPGPATGTDRVLRGGGWPNASFNMRVAIRLMDGPSDQVSAQGFRCVRN